MRKALVPEIITHQNQYIRLIKHTDDPPDNSCSTGQIEQRHTNDDSQRIQKTGRQFISSNHNRAFQSLLTNCVEQTSQRNECQQQDERSQHTVNLNDPL